MKLLFNLTAIIGIAVSLTSPLFADNDQPVIDAQASEISSSLFGKIQLDLATNIAVSPKISYLPLPYRLVLDFENLDFKGLPIDFGEGVGAIEQINHGQTQKGARMVFTFSAPVLISSFVASKTALDGQAGLRLVMEKTSEEEFQKTVETLGYKGPDLGYETIPEAKGAKELPLIVIDPGHGGVDPGAVRDGVSEKAITMRAANLIANVLLTSNRYQVALTRDNDVFVPLINRRRVGEKLGADLFLSIHADTVEVGDAEGSTVYMLSESATSEFAEKFALFENRVDLFAGEYLNADKGDLTNILADMASNSSQKKALAFAKQIKFRWESGQTARPTKIESAAFAVLKSPEVPSLLLELGYLSNANDRVVMQDDLWIKQKGIELQLALDAIFYPDITKGQ